MLKGIEKISIDDETRKKMIANKEEFIKIFKENITRNGSDELLKYLKSDSSDFFEAPASTRFHGSYVGGLLQHSLNVYHCLKDYLERDRVKTIYNLNPSNETIAIIALLHDMCKMNFYEVSERNKKDKFGKWTKEPFFTVNDTLPYGHGEKSVYMISGFMRLKRDEAFAIRYHMGFSGPEDNNIIGTAFEMFPLAFALCVADQEATYFLENEKD